MDKKIKNSMRIANIQKSKFPINEFWKIVMAATVGFNLNFNLKKFL